MTTDRALASIPASYAGNSIVWVALKRWEGQGGVGGMERLEPPASLFFSFAHLIWAEGSMDVLTIGFIYADDIKLISAATSTPFTFARTRCRARAISVVCIAVALNRCWTKTHLSLDSRIMMARTELIKTPRHWVWRGTPRDAGLPIPCLFFEMLFSSRLWQASGAGPRPLACPVFDPC